MKKIYKTLAVVSLGAALAAAPGMAFSSSNGTNDTTVYKVVVNHEEQYSIWPADRENAIGWHDAGFSGSKQECLDYMEEVWTDMRPLSLRKKMEEMGHSGQTDQESNATWITTYSGSVAIIHLPWKMTMGEGDVGLRNAVNDVLNAGVGSIVLEMSHVSTMDDAGIGELVSLLTSVENKGGRLVLSNVPQSLLDELCLTALITVFTIYDSENDAIAALK
ncbi:MAG: MbtH family NRPS accessory protein [bacterium]|nr:MbtH family NRPS accessory protein [bacterium]